MPQVKAMRPLEIFSKDEWQSLTTISPVKGFWLIAHCWLVIFAAIALALWSGHWAVWILAIILVGGRQLGLAILMHDAAHGHLHPKRAVNNFCGEWLTGAAVGSDLQAYRAYHLSHHRYTQQPEDPDLSLSAPFPASRTSMARKILRDISGIAFFRARSRQFAAAFLGLLSRDKAIYKVATRSVFRMIIVNLILATICWMVTGALWGYLIWFIALATTNQLFLRIRNIAEHACTPTGSEDPFSHARTTYANMLERATVAPYWVNYHSEHHMFMGVPCYHLAKAHRMLLEKGHGGKMIIAPDYRAVLQLATLS